MLVPPMSMTRTFIELDVSSVADTFGSIAETDYESEVPSGGVKYHASMFLSATYSLLFLQSIHSKWLIGKVFIPLKLVSRSFDQVFRLFLEPNSILQNGA